LCAQPTEVALHGPNHVRDYGPLREPLDALRHRNHVLSFFDDPRRCASTLSDVG
jgi:hypothetical protein